LLVGVVLYIRGLYKKSLKALRVGMEMIGGPAAVVPFILVQYLQPQWLNLQPVWKAIAISGNILWLFFFIFILGPKWKKKIERKYSE
jgi:hypothetical protein